MLWCTASCGHLVQEVFLPSPAIASDVEGLEFFGREENKTLNDSSTERSIRAISQDMADFWMEKGECGTNDLTEFFSLID